ncbi:MAG: ATP-binding protein [Gammaproteobacteria bacterium]|nr:ATP-binding protein [Gammaproteobacteria bacterium]
MKRQLNIKYKLLLLLLLSIGVSMLLAGSALSYFIYKDYKESAEKSFNNFYRNMRGDLLATENEILASAENIASRGDLVSSLSLVSGYSDINNYQPLIFDTEKESMAKTLSNFARSARLDHVRVYDNKNWLVSFSDYEAGHFDYGYITFVNKSPQLRAYSTAHDEYKGLPEDSFWLGVLRHEPEHETVVYYTELEKGIAIEAMLPVKRVLPDKTSIDVGYVVITKFLTNEYFLGFYDHEDAISGILTRTSHFIGNVTKFTSFDVVRSAPDLFTGEIQSQDSVFDNDDYLIKSFSVPLYKGGVFYLVTGLSKSSVDEQVKKAQIIMVVVFGLSALMVLPVGFVFVERGIVEPVEHLAHCAESLTQGDYSISERKFNSEEFTILKQSLNRAARTIDARETELYKAHTELEQRVADRTKDLKLTNQKLAEEVVARVRAQRDLMESSNMLQLVIDNIPQFVFWKDFDSNYLGCNVNFLNASGFSSVHEIIGKSDYDMPWSRQESDFYRQCDRRVMDGDAPELNIMETQHTADGKVIYVETNKIPLHDSEGRVIGILGTFQDITERKKAEEELLNAKNLAEQANLAKSDFLSRMSHELRTPLNAILGFSQLLSFEELSEQQKDNINEIINSGHHLLDLINEILDLAKIESGKLVLDYSLVGLSACIDECLKVVASLANDKGVQLDKSDMDKDLCLYTDDLRLKQILINLISNAIKYNKPDGRVVIACKTIADQFVEISITDTGKGISVDDMDKLFMPFERMGIEKSGIDGTGIGLVITKDLVELMGGAIKCSSKIDEGSCFSFTLPVNQNVDIEQTSVGAVSVRPEVLPVLNKVRKILYVEDNLANMKLVRSILGDRPNINFLSAETGEEGLEIARKELPDLILMDINLPGINGYEALALLRQDEKISKIPVVALSANAMTHDIKRGEKESFDRYLTKPFDVIDFLKVIDEIMS